MKITREWLSNPKHYDVLSTKQLGVLLTESIDNEIGISSFGIKLTSGLLGSVS